MFGHQYSEMWIDFRGIQDAYMRGRGIDYFENSRRATIAQRTYAMQNPMGWRGYSADVWGLTASDGPFDGTVTIDGASRTFHTYWARGVSAAERRDDGTIAPTAALSSMPYTPAQSLDALKYFYRTQGERLWGQYGFYDAFNLEQNWFAPSYLAIDQGPIIVMIENHRTGLLWEKFMKNPEIQPALDAIGFMPDGSGTKDNLTEIPGFDARIFPNPAAPGAPLQAEFSIVQAQKLTATILNVQGVAVRTLFRDRAFPAGVFHLRRTPFHVCRLRALPSPPSLVRHRPLP